MNIQIWFHALSVEIFTKPFAKMAAFLHIFLMFYMVCSVYSTVFTNNLLIRLEELKSVKQTIAEQMAIIKETNATLAALKATFMKQKGN